MKKEILEFIKSNNISPFGESNVKNENVIYRTKDAKSVHARTITKISENFKFKSTREIWKLFNFSSSPDEIRKRQAFFSSIKDSINSDFLKIIKQPKISWKPKY